MYAAKAPMQILTSIKGPSPIRSNWLIRPFPSVAMFACTQKSVSCASSQFSAKSRRLFTNALIGRSPSAKNARALPFELRNLQAHDSEVSPFVREETRLVSCYRNESPNNIPVPAEPVRRQRSICLGRTHIHIQFVPKPNIESPREQ